jgi:hypothetical protein
MAEMKGQNWQDVQESSLPVLGTPERTTNEVILSRVDRSFNEPVRIYAAVDPDSRLYFEASEVLLGDGAVRNLMPVEETIVDSVSGSLNYQLITSMVDGITLTRDGASYTHPVATASGKFIAGVFCRKKNGTFDSTYSAEQNTLNQVLALDLGTLFADIGGLPIGYIFLESTDNAGRWKTAGSVSGVIENRVGSQSTIGRIHCPVDLDYFRTQILSLQTQIDTINNTYPQEEYYEAVSAGHRAFSVSGFTFDPDNSRKDIQVFRNMGRLKSPKDFSKTSSTAILLTFDPAIGDEILIDKRR